MGSLLRTKVVGHPRLEGCGCVLPKRRNLSKDRIAQARCVLGKTAVWAPNLKRFAFNLGYGPGTVGEAVAFYQFRDNKWVALQSPVDEASKHTQLAQLARKYSAENTYRKGGFFASA